MKYQADLGFIEKKDKMELPAAHGSLAVSVFVGGCQAAMDCSLWKGGA